MRVMRCIKKAAHQQLGTSKPAKDQQPHMILRSVRSDVSMILDVISVSLRKLAWHRANDVIDKGRENNRGCAMVRVKSKPPSPSGYSRVAIERRHLDIWRPRRRL